MVQKNTRTERETTKRTVFKLSLFQPPDMYSYVEARDTIKQVFILSCTCPAAVTGALLHNKPAFTTNFGSFLTCNSI
jgi:hypothetical protein